MTAGLLGLLDAISTIALGFGPGGFAATLVFVVICTVFVLTCGAALGAVTAAIVRLAGALGLRGWDDDGGLWWQEFRLPARLWAGAVLAFVWTGLVFVSVFQLGPLFEYSMLGADGFLSPFELAHGVALAGILSAGAAVFVLIYLRGVRSLTLRSLWLVGFVGLGWQVFHQVYVVSYLPPVSWMHAMQTLALVGFITASWLILRWTSIQRVSRAKFGGVMTAVVVATLFLPVVVGLVVERTTDDQMRLMLHERTAVTFRLLDMLPDAIGPAGYEVPEECELPEDVDLQPDNCPGVDETPTVDGVVLIVVDTLREDRLRAERNGQPLMPNLRAFAEESHEYERAYAPSASTMSSFGAIKSGRVAPIDKLQDGAQYKLLADALADAGVWTAAIPAHTHLGVLIAGFEYVDTSIIDTDEDLRFAVTDADVTDRTLEALNQAPEDRPFFVMAHYFGPHAYYVRHDDYPFGWSAVDRYDAEVAYTDEQIGALLEQLYQIRPDDDLAVIITADHGEELFDHRYSHHGVRLYNETIHIPLIVDFPFDFDCQICNQPVSLTDLAPTMASLLDTDQEPFSSAGAVCLHGGRLDKDRPVFLQATNRRGLVLDQFKYIEEHSNQIRQLYHLVADPEEHHNLIGQQPRRDAIFACLLELGSEDVVP